MKQTNNNDRKLNHTLYLGEHNGIDFEIEFDLWVAWDIDWHGNGWVGLENYEPRWLYVNGDRSAINDERLLWVLQSIGVDPDSLEDLLQEALDEDLVEGAYLRM